ncbi:UDP binding domain-containing protein [Acinetobacter gerneri]|jgi:UDPglucose 6-dehydrogenase|uniref:UDP binding domain-containing protein n=1 Tax=Acinetobacter gerneri TaxID=202952 RepID=UPI0023F1F42C|nr:UDP binding domain-containing protein [Acinetobacter gerneri]MCH4244365.1 UDP-glucose 6-dehydrogenase [Acinetobacter gerneri]
MKIAVFGATLQGAVMSTLFAETGHFVSWCPRMDSSLFQLANLNLDSQLIYLIEKQKKVGFLNIGGVEVLDQNFDAYLFALDPLNIEIALDIAEILSEKALIHPKLMINGSTFGLHGTARLQQILPKDAWVYLPDMTQDGRSVESLLQATSIVIGVDDLGFAKTQIIELMRPHFPRSEQRILMPILDAEFTKISISGMLATRISYMNDLALVAEKLDIDIENVRLGLSADKRIGASYLYPGVGFGGENFSRDILTLSQTVSDSGNKSRLLQQVWEINEQQKEVLFRKFWNYYHSDIQGKTVAIWGAAFKEKSSSVINSPIHKMLKAFWAQGVTVKLHDPKALKEIEVIYGQRTDLIYCDDQYDMAQDADALCLVTPWRQYANPDYQRLKQIMKHPFILDGRNFYDPNYVKAQGFAYEGVGRL